MRITILHNDNYLGDLWNYRRCDDAKIYFRSRYTHPKFAEI